MKPKKIHRDAAIVKWMDGYLVNTCDSAGGIGTLENDVLKVDITIVTMATLKVALFENISLGAKILSVNMSFANDPLYVKRAVEMAKNFLKVLDIPLVISTEKNFSTTQTGIGVGVIGYAKRLKIGIAEAGDGVYTIGMPMFGNEVIENQENILELEDLIELVNSNYVGEIIPVGSKGIAYEAKNLAKNNSLKLVLKEKGSWLYKSAGPATCAVFSAKRIPKSRKPIRRIGWLEQKRET